MSVYAQMQSLANDALIVVQDGKVLDSEHAQVALEIINKTLLDFKGDLNHEAIYRVGCMQLAYLKHPKLDNIGRSCFVIFVYDGHEHLEALQASALVLGFEGDVLTRLRVLQAQSKKGFSVKKLSLWALLAGGLGALVAFATHTFTHKG
ncbi:hypothetical protein [Helicobacter labacensis]|uniref:hypothetical protein n=1 Tax=Helicobacter labacensis TaxID=2316079 RepID=UPI000EB1F4C5|nr:hypothetical protein [Helicobacter labacensis]